MVSSGLLGSTEEHWKRQDAAQAVALVGQFQSICIYLSMKNYPNLLDCRCAIDGLCGAYLGSPLMIHY